ncbi:hypothetical protein GCM10023187_25020 [Nibrella viscosa]|uniref:Methyltransferase FkbM domain-containing protein n=1 Tax=Nibrella viscosa TaxID=1084524 RepID=A0ABP8KFV8_9BACT
MDKLLKSIKYMKRFGLVNGLKILSQNLFLRSGISIITVPKLVSPIFLRRSKTDIEVFNQIFVELSYDYPLSFEPEFIVDCGANIGLSALFFKSKYPKAQIVAIEPEATNFNLLIKNVSSYSEIFCIRAGIWNTNTVLKVEDENSFGNWGFNCRPVNEKSLNTVNAITINQIMSQYNKSEIDVLKIDIEGSELELFSDKYEKWLPNTKVIMIETHDFIRKGCSKSFFSAISKYNFSVFLRGENFICIRD